MSEYADKYSNPHRKERVERMLQNDPKARIDASGYTPPDALNADKQTGPCKPKPRAFAKGGKVEGEKAHKHAGRKSRDAGGETAVQQLRPNVPISGLYGSGFTPTHAGMMSTAGGLKKGGMAKRHKRADGGTSISDHPDYTTPSMSAARVAYANRDKLKAAMTNDPDMNEELRQNNRDYRDQQNSENNPQHDRRGGMVKKRADGGRNWIAEATKHKGALHKKLGVPQGDKIPAKKLEKAEHSKSPTLRKEANLAETLKGLHKAKGGEVPGNTEITGTRPTGGRLARAHGGKAKGKTNINIIIASKPDQSQVPPPPSAIPPGTPMPKPGLPPAALGAMAGPMMGQGAPMGAAAPAMPAGMPAGMGPR